MVSIGNMPQCSTIPAQEPTGILTISDKRVVTCDHVLPKRRGLVSGLPLEPIIVVVFGHLISKYE